MVSSVLFTRCFSSRIVVLTCLLLPLRCLQTLVAWNSKLWNSKLSDVSTCLLGFFKTGNSSFFVGCASDLPREQWVSNLHTEAMFAVCKSSTWSVMVSSALLARCLNPRIMTVFLTCLRYVVVVVWNWNCEIPSCRMSQRPYWAFSRAQTPRFLSDVPYWAFSRAQIPRFLSDVPLNFTRTVSLDTEAVRFVVFKSSTFAPGAVWIWIIPIRFASPFPAHMIVN
jgi:hypothetical protein